MPASNTLADTNAQSAVPPPAFASNISYRESKGKFGRFMLAGGGLAILLFAAVVAMLVWRQISTSNERQNETNETGPQAVDNATTGNNNIALSNRPRPISKADQTFSQINVQLNSADIVKNKVAIERDVKAAMGRFTDDYRFAYQAAKLEAITSKGHHEAFEMLHSVARQAIETGKSAELLINLQQDGKDTLRRLTDHKELKILEKALRNNDMNALELK